MVEPFFIGVDVGTQGVRVNLIDSVGNLLGAAEQVFLLSGKLREEQSPLSWWEAFKSSLALMLDSVDGKLDRNKILSIAVTSTSGTVIPIDRNYSPLHNAIMYSDKRSAPQALKCEEQAIKSAQNFTAFSFSTGLAKMVWFSETFPAKAARIHKWIHAADFITGRISGVWAVTDYTNAFKSGYDILNYNWPSYLYDKLPLKKEWLPEVVSSGTVIGNLAPDFARMMNLSAGIKVVAGVTDGCASQIAAGAINPGEWNTTIGTTLVIKGVTENEVKDPEGRIYSHRHPLGYWMPGGASNTGADWVTNDFGDDLVALNNYADQHLPSTNLSYPLRQKGERFPFIAPEALGFEPEELSKNEQFLANMEGVAYIERYAFDIIEKLSGEKVKAIFTAGGASNSEAWLKIRSNVLNVPIYKMKYVSGAFGAAILAASKTYFKDLPQSVKALTQIDKEIYPDTSTSKKYNENYEQFLNILADKGYIKKENINA